MWLLLVAGVIGRGPPNSYCNELHHIYQVSIFKKKP